MNELRAKRVASFTNPNKSFQFMCAKEILCADFGGTRIKAAVLHPNITLEELQNISTLAFESEGWMNKEFQREISFPCLGITLGTGIGVALLLSAKDIINIEISVLDTSFRRLFALVGDQPIQQEYGRPAPHDAIGRLYFNWMEKQNNFSELSLQNDFNQRVLAFLLDLQEFLNIEITSVMIGGGNSRFIHADALSEQLKKDILLLSPSEIGKFRVSPDIISLLGCLQLSDHKPVEMMPTWSEMLPWYLSRGEL